MSGKRMKAVQRKKIDCCWYRKEVENLTFALCISFFLFTEVRCDNAPEVANASRSSASAVYNENVTYTCDVGHTFQNNDVKKRVQNITCGAYGVFNPTSVLPCAGK